MPASECRPVQRRQKRLNVVLLTLKPCPVIFDAQRIVFFDSAPHLKYLVVTFSSTDSVRGVGPKPGSQSALHISMSCVFPRAKTCAPLLFEPQPYPGFGDSGRRRSVARDVQSALGFAP